MCGFSFLPARADAVPRGPQEAARRPLRPVRIQPTVSADPHLESTSDCIRHTLCWVGPASAVGAAVLLCSFCTLCSTACVNHGGCAAAPRDGASRPKRPRWRHSCTKKGMLTLAPLRVVSQSGHATPARTMPLHERTSLSKHGADGDLCKPRLPACAFVEKRSLQQRLGQYSVSIYFS